MISGSCHRSAQPASHPEFGRIGCPHAWVLRFDRTMLRRCSAVPLGPLALRVNGPSNSARRRAARPHQLSSTVPEPRHKSHAGILFLPVRRIGRRFLSCGRLVQSARLGVAGVGG